MNFTQIAVTIKAELNQTHFRNFNNTAFIKIIVKRVSWPSICVGWVSTRVIFSSNTMWFKCTRGGARIIGVAIWVRTSVLWLVEKISKRESTMRSTLCWVDAFFSVIGPALDAFSCEGGSSNWSLESEYSDNPQHQTRINLLAHVKSRHWIRFDLDAQTILLWMMGWWR